MIALVGYWGGSIAVLVSTAFLIAARCFALLYDHHPVVAILVLLVFLVIAMGAGIEAQPASSRAEDHLPRVLRPHRYKLKLIEKWLPFRKFHCIIQCHRPLSIRRSVADKDVIKVHSTLRRGGRELDPTLHERGLFTIVCQIAHYVAHFRYSDRIA